MYNIILHFMLDMSGAVTFACLLKGCSNKNHVHSKAVQKLVQHRWITQAISALIVAIVTVKVVG